MTPIAVEIIRSPLAHEFEELFREHYPLVYRTAYGITGRAEDAEDVLQTVFLKLLRRKASPDFQKNPKGYLYRAAVNTALDILQARRRHTQSEIETDLPSQAHDPADSYDTNRELLTHALAQLRPRAVEILMLRYEHDYSDAEIAKMLGTSRGVIAVSLYRTRARLKKLLRPPKAAYRSEPEGGPDAKGEKR
jgi:RNA polymerase sigma-70 factor (ECF subfamily)